jgi:hypothetical protein
MNADDDKDLPAKPLARMPFFDTSNERELKCFAEADPEKMNKMAMALVIMKLPRILAAAGFVLAGLIGVIRAWPH